MWVSLGGAGHGLGAKIETAVAQIGKAVVDTDARFNKHIEATETNLNTRLDTAKADIHREIMTLASAEEMALLGHTVSKLQENLTRLQSTSQSRAQEIASGIAGLDSILGDLQTRFLGQLEVMPTATQTTEDRKATMKKIEGEAAQVGKVVADMDTGLNKHIGAIETSLNTRLDTAKADIHREMMALASAEELAQLDRSISSLQKKLDQLTTTAQKSKKAEGNRAAEGKGPGERVPDE